MPVSPEEFFRAGQTLKNNHKNIDMNTQKYETGATSHAVNDLVLFADNTKKLVDIRDKIYREHVSSVLYASHFLPLFNATRMEYKRVFPGFLDHQHISFENETYGVHSGTFTADQQHEFLMLYVNDFENWKNENM